MQYVTCYLKALSTAKTSEAWLHYFQPFLSAKPRLFSTLIHMMGLIMMNFSHRMDNRGCGETSLYSFIWSIHSVPELNPDLTPPPYELKSCPTNKKKLGSLWFFFPPT